MTRQVSKISKYVSLVEAKPQSIVKMTMLTFVMNVM